MHNVLVASIGVGKVSAYGCSVGQLWSVSAVAAGTSNGKTLGAETPPTETCADMHLPLHSEQTKEKFERFKGKSAQIIITCRKIVQLCLSGGSSG